MKVSRENFKIMGINPEEQPEYHNCSGICFNFFLLFFLTNFCLGKKTNRSQAKKNRVGDSFFNFKLEIATTKSAPGSLDELSEQVTSRGFDPLPTPSFF